MWLDLVERVVEGEVQNVKRSSFLTKHRPRNCSHNLPRAPTAPTHPKPTRTHLICRHARKGLYPAIPSFELWNSRCGIFCGHRVKRWPIGHVRSGDLSVTVPLFIIVAGGLRFRGPTYILSSDDSQSSSSFLFPPIFPHIRTFLRFSFHDL